MLEAHGVDYLARCQHVDPEIWVGGFEVGLAGGSNAGQQCCGKGAAGSGEIRVLLCGYPVQGNNRSSGIPRMDCWHVPIGAVPVAAVFPAWIAGMSQSGRSR